MRSPIVRLLPSLLVSALAGMAHVSAATAEDFNFDVPVDIDVSPSGASSIIARVSCLVSTTRHPGGGIGASAREVVAREARNVPIDPVSGSLHTVVRLRMNATNPRLLSASMGRFYHCEIEDLNYYFGDGPGVALSGDYMATDYERLTGLGFRRDVRAVTGEIAR